MKKIFTVFWIIQAALIAGKIIGLIKWSKWFVFMPVMIFFFIMVVCLIIICMFQTKSFND